MRSMSEEITHCHVLETKREEINQSFLLAVLPRMSEFFYVVASTNYTGALGIFNRYEKLVESVPSFF